MLRNITLLLVCLLFAFNASTQIIQQKMVLVEEFTSTNTEECVEQSMHLDSITNSYWQKVVRIKYHTDFEGDDPLYDESKAGVDRRLEKYDFVESVPQMVLEGHFRPEGDLELGATGNLTRDHIWDALIDPNYYFFGIEHNFTADYKEMFISGGGVSTGIGGSSTVYYTQAIIEQVVNFEEPFGPDDELQYNYVFRTFPKYRKGTTIPGNGSTHGWDKISIPSNVKNLDQLGVVHIFEDANGKVLNCYYDPPYNVHEYRLTVSTLTDNQHTFFDSIVQPSIRIKNTGSMPVSEFYIASTLDDNIQRDTVYQILEPGTEFTYKGDSIILGPGKHNISIYVEDFAERIPGSVLNNDLKQTRYFVYGNFEAPDEGFEAYDSLDEIGHFLDVSENIYAFKNVSSAYFDTEDSIGAYGLSDHALMVDFYHWNYDWNNSSANEAKMIYGTFDLEDMVQPKLKFDVALSGKLDFWNIFDVKFISSKGGVQYKYRATHLYTMPDQDHWFIPNSNTAWKTLEIDLEKIAGSEVVALEILVRTPSQKLNTLYMDNFRIVDDYIACAPDGVTLSSQDELDEFTQQYGECNVILGDLCIGNCADSLTASDISDLSGLKSIQEVKGDLRLVGLENVEFMHDFDQVNTIGGNLIVRDNPQLKNLHGLFHLEHVGKDIEIANCDSLSSIETLDQIDLIDGNFTLENLPVLQSFKGLSKLRWINGDLMLKNIPGPTNMNGIGSLYRVGGSVTIDSVVNSINLLTIFFTDTLQGSLILRNLDSLRAINLLPELKHIKGDLIIENLHEVHDLDGLQDLRKIDGKIEIRGNASLLSIEGVGDLDSLSLSIDPELDASLILSSNPILSICENTFVCNFLDNRPDEALIENNDYACNSIDDVIQSCIVPANEIASSQLILYPNPTLNTLNVFVEKSGAFEILDLLGNRLLKGALQSGENKIDLSELSPGIYLFGINEEQKWHRLLISPR